MSLEKMVCGVNYSTELIKNNINGLIEEVTGSTEPVQASELLNYYPSAGQSLSIGYTALENAPINTGDLADVYLYNGVPAIAPGSTESITPTDVASVVSFNQPTRETHIYAMLETLKEKVGGTWLVAPFGRGGESIEDLTKGTEPYLNGEVMRDGAVAAATSLSKAGVNIPFTTWIQGESDVVNNVDWYNSELTAYINYFNDDYASISGGSTIPVFTTQVGTSGSVKFAANELDFSNQNPLVTCAGPNWPISRLYPSSTTDYTHLNAQGYIHLGNMLEASIEQVVYRDNPSYRPLQPEKVSITGSAVSLNMHVPTGSLEIDTTTFPEAPMLGIKYIYGGSFSTSAGTYRKEGNKLVLNYNMSGLPIVVGSIIEGGNTLTDDSTTDGISVPLINLRGSDSLIKDWKDWCCQFRIEVTKEMGALDPETDNVWTFGTPTIDTTDSFVTIAGTSACYFLDGTTYQVDYDSADITSGTARLWVGDESHTIDALGGSLIMTRGSSTRLRIQSGNGGFSGRVKNLTIKKLS